MLTLRRRGRNYHVRGTIRVGQETRVVEEHSTGCHSREDAEAYRARLEHEIRQELLHGDQGRPRQMTIADAGLLYVNRPGGVKAYDLWRLGQLNEVLGDMPVASAKQGWSEFKKVRCARLKPATVERFRAILQAALNYAAESEGFTAPKLPTTKGAPKKRIRFLSEEQQDRLLDAYTAHVRPIALTLCFEGMRAGEALRLDWQHVRWGSDELFLPETKNGEERTVRLHERVRKALHRLWVERGSPTEGHVFLNRFGKPYSDVRTYKLPGGNPLSKAHATACRRARIKDFRVHDWRHHWACWCVMSGINLEAIRQEGGWKTLRMVERYASVSAEHRREEMRKRR